MYGSVVFLTQNLAVSGANQVLVNLIRGRFLGSPFIVISPTSGPLDRTFNEAGAAVVVGDVEKHLHSIRDIRLAICNTVMTAHLILILNRRKIPHLWILHEWWTDEILHKELASRKLSHLTASTVEEALASCDRVVCVCESQRSVYNIRSPSSVIYVGVHSPPDSLPSVPRKQLKFLYMGIICPRKNQVKAVELFKRFAEDRTDVSLDVVGARYVRDYEIEYVEKVKAAAGNDPRIRILDVTNDPWSYYQAADVLLLCSLNEVTPLVLCEAMLSGMPVITTDVAGIPEMVHDGKDGFVVASGDDEAFISAMHAVADSSDLRKSLGENGRQHALKSFCLDRMVREYATLARTVSPITLLIDMDGVLVDWDAGFEAVWNGRAPIDRCKSYIMQDCVPTALKAEATAISREPGFFASLPPAQGGIDAVKHLAGLPGFNVLICTAPLWANPTCVPDKLEWIERHLGPEWLRRTVLSHDKTCVRGDVLIDDKPDIDGAQHPTWIQAVFDQPYNANLCKETFKYRMKDWMDQLQWKSMLLRLLKDVGHRLEPEDLAISAEDFAASDASIQYRKAYQDWRQGSPNGASGRVDLCTKREELDALLLEQAVLDCDDFEEIFMFRKQYRDWRLGSPRGAKSRHV